MDCEHDRRFHIFGAVNGCLACQCEELSAENERLQAVIERLQKERDALLACRHGEQRCSDCPDTECCDNLSEAAEAAGGR